MPFLAAFLPMAALGAGASFLAWLVAEVILAIQRYNMEAKERKREKAEEELERKRVALISRLSTLLDPSWSYLSQPGHEPLLESVKGTHCHLVLEGLRELDLMPQELLDLDTEIELAREKVQLYLIEIRAPLRQSVEEAQRFARAWNRPR